LCKEARAQRDDAYKALLLEQKSERHELQERQAQGLSSPKLLDRTYPELPSRADEPQVTAAPKQVSPKGMRFVAGMRAVTHPEPENPDASERPAIAPKQQQPAEERAAINAGGVGPGLFETVQAARERLRDEAFYDARREPEPTKADTREGYSQKEVRDAVARAIAAAEREAASEVAGKPRDTEQGRDRERDRD
jgi:hypothetical protein